LLAVEDGVVCGFRGKRTAGRGRIDLAVWRRDLWRMASGGVVVRGVAVGVEGGDVKGGVAKSFGV